MLTAPSMELRHHPSQPPILTSFSVARNNRGFARLACTRSLRDCVLRIKRFNHAQRMRGNAAGSAFPPCWQ